MPECSSYGNLGKVTQNPHFLKNAKGGRRETFQRSFKKQPLLKKANSTLAEMALSCNYYAVKMQRLEKIVAQKKLQKCPKGQVMAIFETSPKTRVF